MKINKNFNFKKYIILNFVKFIMNNNTFTTFFNDYFFNNIGFLLNFINFIDFSKLNELYKSKGSINKIKPLLLLQKENIKITFYKEL